MKDIDWLPITLWIGIAGLGIGIVCLGLVVLSNVGSRSLLAALSALLGASFALLISMYFDLRSKTENAFMSSEYTIDRSKPQIRQWVYPNVGAGWRMTSEMGASDALATAKPREFEGDLAKMAEDMTI